MKLQVLSKADCEQVRLWRNESLVALRTSFPLTEGMQERFYDDVVDNKDYNKAQYWGIHIDADDELIGMCGIENIDWIARRAEISIIINPEYHGKGYGEQAVELLLEQGFMYMNLENIWGECYKNNPAMGLWHKVIAKYNSFTADLVNTKYWNGYYQDSMWFNIKKEAWLKCRK